MLKGLRKFAENLDTIKALNKIGTNGMGSHVPVR